jgi:hypothetical protein
MTSKRQRIPGVAIIDRSKKKKKKKKRSTADWGISDSSWSMNYANF